ncbi:amidohydrolase family protein [Vibrio europaeus]|uniref:amidohydrolase family protein n=1 Tax=Vibrio europaeus TaxID=300876 RepID=UPI00233EF0A3|nr:amidohydrolase family protein [Vibrio europaeus]MDC5815963.1 amidohydrolase family protein [Vibrio europaeus]
MSLKTSLSTIALLVSASVNAADEVYVNGQVYTVNENQPWAEAFAVEGGKFVQVGNTNEIKKLMNSSTKLIDLQGQFVMPGMIDDHIHPGFGAEMVMNVGTEYAMTYEQFGEKIGQFRKNNPDTKWVYGGPLNWLSDDNGLIEVFNQPSNKSILDKFVSDKPAFFWDVGGHAALVNSKALEMLNITKDTPDPKGGVYVRDANGDLTGVLRECGNDCLGIIPCRQAFKQRVCIQRVKACLRRNEQLWCHQHF